MKDSNNTSNPLYQMENDEIKLDLKMSNLVSEFKTDEIKILLNILITEIKLYNIKNGIMDDEDFEGELIFLDLNKEKDYKEFLNIEKRILKKYNKLIKK
jgi:hypothetical protein